MARLSARVRPAEAGDVDALVDLVGALDTSTAAAGVRATLEESRPDLAARLTEILLEGTRALLVAVDEASGELVGLLIARNDDLGAIEPTPVLHVTHLIVSAGHRRRGVGRTLLAAAVNLADDRGMDRVLATVASGSREANRYLARLGFAPLVMHRLASTSVLRRSLGMAEAPERVALLRRARLVRAQRAGFASHGIRHGA